MSLDRLRQRLLGLSDATTFALVVLAVLVFAFVFTYPRQWSRGLLINDEMWYGHLARSVHQGEGYVTRTIYPMQAPEVDTFPAPEALKQAGYPLLTAAAWNLTGVGHRAMVALALAGAALAAGLVYLLGRAVGWGRFPSLFLVGAIFLSPSVAVPLTAALPESWYLALFVATLALLLRGTTPSLVAAGLAHAALLIFKGHGILYVPVFLAWLALAGRRRRRWSRAGAYAGALVAGLVVASLLLPSGSVQLFRSGGNYSLAFLIDTDRSGAEELPYYELEPPDAVDYILAHPAEYAEKYLRMVSRTKVILEGLAGPALGGVVFFLLGVSLALLLADLARPGWILPRATTDLPPDVDRRVVHLLFIAVLAVTFLFFWGVHLTARFVLHTYPLMLLLVFEVASRFGRFVRPMEPRLRATLVGLGLLYVVAYPAASSLWQSYRDPYAHLGRQLAVRFVDYREMADDVETLPPGPVVSDMAHEIEWHTGRPTILFPLNEDGLRVLVDKYDVVGLYEHPIVERDWPWMRAHFRLVDDDNGRFWVRRGGPAPAGAR